MRFLVQIPRKFSPSLNLVDKLLAGDSSLSLFERRYVINSTYNIYLFSLGGTAFMKMEFGDCVRRVLLKI